MSLLPETSEGQPSLMMEASAVFTVWASEERTTNDTANTHSQTASTLYPHIVGEGHTSHDGRCRMSYVRLHSYAVHE